MSHAVNKCHGHHFFNASFFFLKKQLEVYRFDVASYGVDPRMMDVEREN